MCLLVVFVWLFICGGYLSLVVCLYVGCLSLEVYTCLLVVYVYVGCLCLVVYVCCLLS